MRPFLAALLGVVALLCAATPAHAAPCADAGVVVTPETTQRARAAVLCLVNAERRARGLVALRAGAADLQREADRYAADMARRDFYSHLDPEGRSFGDRLDRALSGLLTSLGENLLWGDAGRRTPSFAVEGWMGSPGHRANILTPEFREAGIGIAPDAPSASAEGPGATFVLELVARDAPKTTRKRRCVKRSKRTGRCTKRARR